MISVPLHDQPTFNGLRAPALLEYRLRERIVNEARALMGQGLGVRLALERAATLNGKPYSSVKNWHYAGRAEGWRGLINGRRLGSNKSNVSPLFLEYWAKLVLSNQRDTERAYARFVAQYHAGATIPGLPAVEERSPNLPRGYGRRNLIRKHYLPPKASVELARQGVAAARAHLPTGPQDLSEVRPLEYILFDDVELDFLIVVPGCERPVKVRLIVAMDLCSRVILGYGVRPAIPRPDGVEDGLKLRDMKMVVARVIRTWGVPMEYQMHLICERGTAALPTASKTALAEISGGQIVVHDTSMIAGQVFAFRDKATGNSWGKAWLESFFNSLHSELADLPGQKGRRYDLAPAELEGRRKEVAALLRAGRALPIELRQQFRMPFLNGAEAMQELDAALARLHARTQHQLNCFAEIGIWRLTPSDPWKPASELPEVLLDRMEQLFWDRRMESPMERFQRLLPTSGARREVHESGLMRLMEEQARVRYESLSFVFVHDRAKYTYLPTPALLAQLTEGEHYLLWFHGADMEAVYVTRDRPHLGYVGKLTRFTAGRKGDLEDAKNYLREKERLFSHALDAAQQPKVDDLRARADDLAHNTELIESVRALEVEVEVVGPTDKTDGGMVESVRAMTADRAARARRVVEEAKEDPRVVSFADFLPSEEGDFLNP